MWIHAPWVLPIDRGPLKNHSILIKNGKIASILPYAEAKNSSEEGKDLPNTILLPGLINAHCHLELSNLPHEISYPGTFVGWVAELTRLKMELTSQDYEKAFERGISLLMNAGTTTLSDHLSAGMDPTPLLQSPLTGYLFSELLGVSENRINEVLMEAQKTEKILKEREHHFIYRQTPHASYSLSPKIFYAVTQQKGLSSIHVAESDEEFLLFKENRGPFYEFLSQRGAPPLTKNETPVRFLYRSRLLPKNILMVHANCLETDDLPILREREASVVHCPGSHRYFDHPRFLYGMLKEEGINIALGTDSLASNSDLNMFKEMQYCLDSFAELTPRDVLQMATLCGAKALQMEKKIGTLEIGKEADIIGVKIQNPKADPYENVLMNTKVNFYMKRGKEWLTPH